MRKTLKSETTGHPEFRSPMKTAGLVIETSAARTVGPVTTFSGPKETQKVIEGLLDRAKTVHSKLSY